MNVLGLISQLIGIETLRLTEITWVEHNVAWGWRRGADLGLGMLGMAWVNGLGTDLGLGVLGVAWVNSLGADLGLGVLSMA